MLPGHLKVLFWESVFEKLDPGKDRDLIVPSPSFAPDPCSLEAVARKTGGLVLPDPLTPAQRQVLAKLKGQDAVQGFEAVEGLFPCASLLDIALMKLTAIADRGARKDFIDLYAILRSGIALKDVLAELPRKFPGGSSRAPATSSTTS